MQIAVITGCNRGAGSGIRDVFLNVGFKVYGLNKTKSDFEHINYQEVLCDVTSVEQVKTITDILPEQIDVLVINAGVRRFDNVENMTSLDWNDSVNTNLNGAFYVINSLIPNLKRASGFLAIVGSHSEKYSFEGGSAYCSTKLALKGLSECLMDELRYDDVRVSYLSLGSIKNRDHGYDESWKLTPVDVGQTILSLVELPKNILIPYLDVRPAKPLRSPLSGMERLQYV